MCQAQTYGSQSYRANQSAQTGATSYQWFLSQFGGKCNPLTNPRFDVHKERLISTLMEKRVILPRQYEHIEFLTVPNSRMEPNLPYRSVAVGVEILTDKEWHRVSGTIMCKVDGHRGWVVGDVTRYTYDHIDLTPIDTDKHEVLTLERGKVLYAYQVVYCDGITLSI